MRKSVGSAAEVVEELPRPDQPAQEAADGGEALRLQSEAISRFDPEERQIAKAVLDSPILQHEARRWAPLAGRKERRD